MSVASRIKDRKHQLGVGNCAIPGCGRPTAAAAGVGLAIFHCRYHVQHRARHGSHWHPTYKAAELKPYLVAAASWVATNRDTIDVKVTLGELAGLLRQSGTVEMAQNLRGLPAAERARIAFARLSEAGIDPDRILAIHLAVAALIEDDAGSHRVREFRIVQVAKAVHRLASGTHKHWEMFNYDKPPVKIELHAYPRSSGLVLRVIGEKIERACEYVTGKHVDDVRAFKRERFGSHPSELPGWQPVWARRR